MNDYTVKRLALVLSVQAEIEGMKAANDRQKTFPGAEPHYTELHFDNKAEELRILASKHDEQL